MTGIMLPPSTEPKSITELGSKLFLRCVSGTRVISNVDHKKINGYEFKGWGAHCDSYPFSYMTAAATIGMTSTDINQFLQRFTKVMESWKKDAACQLLSITHKSEDDEM